MSMARKGLKPSDPVLLLLRENVNVKSKHKKVDRGLRENSSQSHLITHGVTIFCDFQRSKESVKMKCVSFPIFFQKFLNCGKAAEFFVKVTYLIQVNYFKVPLFCFITGTSEDWRQFFICNFFV